MTDKEVLQYAKTMPMTCALDPSPFEDEDDEQGNMPDSIEMTLGQIAETIGTTRQNVNSILNRAIEKIFRNLRQKRIIPDLYKVSLIDVHRLG